MKLNKYLIISVALLAAFTILFSGCKNFGHPEFKLSIEMKEGTQGTPVSGTYSYDEFSKVDYNYSSSDENIQIEVLVNGNKKTLSGTFTIYNNLTVIVQRIDIRDTWTFSYIKADGTTDNMDITFSGETLFSGTFEDSRGYTGTWKVENNDLTIVFSDWEDYVFTGLISTMTGDYIGGGISGTWSASRKI